MLPTLAPSRAVRPPRFGVAGSSGAAGGAGRTDPGSRSRSDEQRGTGDPSGQGEGHVAPLTGGNDLLDAVTTARSPGRLRRANVKSWQCVALSAADKNGQKRSGPKGLPNPCSPLFSRASTDAGATRRKPAHTARGPDGRNPSGRGPVRLRYCAVTIRTASAARSALPAPAAPPVRHWLSVFPAVHSRPAYETRSMCSAEALATAQCASCQPRSRTPRPGRSPCRRSRAACTVRPPSSASVAARGRRRRGRRLGADLGRGRVQHVPPEVPDERAPHLVRTRGPGRLPERPSQVSVAADCPVRAAASSAASGSCLAYACGIAAALHALRGDGQRQPRVAGHLGQVLVELPAAYAGSMISFGVPQPCEGRCWNRPSESRSPCSMLRSADSWSAVARAIVTARSGIPRAVPTAAIVAAFTACSGVNSYGRPVGLARDHLAARRARASGDVLHHEVTGDREQDDEGRPETEEAATTLGSGGRLWHAHKVLESTVRLCPVGTVRGNA